MSTKLDRELQSAQYWLAQERKWFYKDHGGTLSAYTERYGSTMDQDHYGDGGEVIYAADVRVLNEREERVRVLMDAKKERKGQ